MIFTRWLIVRADRVPTMRVVSNLRRLQWDEVAFKLRLTIPPCWGREIGSIDLEIPEGTVVVTPEEFREPGKEAVQEEAESS